MAITASEAVDLLTSNGIAVQVKSFNDVAIAERNARILVRQKPPSPSDVGREMSGEGVVLYVVPRLTESLTKLAARNHRIAIAAIDEGVIIFDGERISSVADVQPTTSRSRRTPWTRFALIRVLARTRRPRTQEALAIEAGGTQASVSINLKRFSEYVRRSNDGWTLVEPEEMIRLHMREYPSAKGISQYWYALGPPVDEARKAAAQRDDVLYSGDVGADYLAPWRSPRTAILYSRGGLNLREIGFAESSPERANIVSTVPADTTIWSTAEAFRTVPAVDPIVCAWDVQKLGGPDAEEAVDRLVEWATERWFAGD
jgi:hypothetical protein